MGKKSSEDKIYLKGKLFLFLSFPVMNKDVANILPPTRVYYGRRLAQWLLYWIPTR